jgi:hypothetical protein
VTVPPERPEQQWPQQQWPQQQWQQPPPGYGYQPYGYGGYGPPGPPPPSHIGWAIAAIFLFWPLAIPAFIYSSRVESAWQRGDVGGAQRASATARTCGIWALVVGIVLIIVWITLFAVVFNRISDCTNNLTSC